MCPLNDNKSIISSSKELTERRERLPHLSLSMLDTSSHFGLNGFSSTSPIMWPYANSFIYNNIQYRLCFLLVDRLSAITVWGSTKETVSTTAYPSTPDWEVISTQDNTIVYLHVIELSNATKFRHIAVSREQKGIVSLKEVQIFSKKSEFHCLFTIKTLYKITVKVDIFSFQ